MVDYFELVGFSSISKVRMRCYPAAVVRLPRFPEAESRSAEMASRLVRLLETHQEEILPEGTALGEHRSAAPARPKSWR